MTQPAQSASALTPLLARLYRQGTAESYAMTETEFAGILSAIAAKHLPAGADPAALYESLRIEELVLARACAAGNEKAWEVFLTRYRARLYEMAGAIAQNDSVARELADSLYGDLYGMRAREGERLSKLAYYTGRGSLEGWLRTVLAQDHIDHFRRQKRLVSMEEQEEQGEQFVSPAPAPQAAADPRVAQATDAALAALPAEDRLVLAAYFLDGRTLAEIARILRVHESTVSRKIDKLARQLRSAIMKRLVAGGLDRRAAEESLELDVRDLAVDVRGRLQSEVPTESFPAKSGRTDVPV